MYTNSSQIYDDAFWEGLLLPSPPVYRAWEYMSTQLVNKTIQIK